MSFVNIEVQLDDNDFNKKSIILYTQKCNMKCPYCFNPELITKQSYYKLSQSVLDAVLRKNEKEYDWVVISGGEPTLHENLYEEVKYIKENFDYKIELCTNGSNFEMVKLLMDNNLIDLFRVDLKTIYTKNNLFGITSQMNKNILKSIEYINDECFEARTVLHQDLLSQSDLNEISKTIFDLEKTNFNVTKFHNGGSTLKKLEDFENIYNFDKIREMFPKFKILSH